MKSKIGFLLIVASLCSGCYVWPTFESPEVGKYSGEGTSFKVGEGVLGAKWIHYSSDHYRYDDILVVAGSFYHQWGQSGGTHCPTDAYIICGHFTSPTAVEGWVRKGHNCSYGPRRYFNLELVVPEAVAWY